MTVSKSLKNGISKICKVIAGIAVCVFILANPIGDNSGIVFIASIIVLVVCGAILGLLEYLSLETEPMTEPPPDPKRPS